jgi:hypothetical protein
MKKKIIIALLLSIIIIVTAVGIFSLQQFTASTPAIPSDFTATEISSTRINLTWMKGKNADTTYIERNNVSAWRRGEGTPIYNDTGKHYQDIVPHHSQYYYQAWSWNQTEHAYSAMVATSNTSAVANQPPIFGFQSPINSSTDTPLRFSWSISISDPEGNPFSWTIQCSNRQVTSGTSAANGTKTILLHDLANTTSYMVRVNATDPTGSGLYTRRWYLFTTTSNQTTNNKPPLFGTPSPANGSTGNLLSLTWSIPINDPEGNTYAWTIQCSNRQVTGGTSQTNGTKTLTLSSLSSATTYKIWVNATDLIGSGLYTRRWYTFTTKTTQTNNTPPMFGTPSPTNGSTGNPLSLTWNIPISDLEGNTFTWTIQCNGQTNSATGASNGTKTLTLSGLSNATSYKVWVNATDPTGSGLYTRKWYTFTTKTNLPPVFGEPTPANRSTAQPLNVLWSIPITDPDGDVFSWMIQCNNGQSNSSTNGTNGTKSLALSGLTHSTSYTVWVNATDLMGSGLYTRRWYTFATRTNSPPVFGTPSPADSSTNNPLNLTWSIPINDTEGDPFSWSIECRNGQTANGTNAANGIKALNLSDLAYSTTYKIWVNATDPTGSHLNMRRWYTFTTIINQAPSPPTITGSDKGHVRVATEYNFTSLDPENNSVYYFIDWGDGTNSSWIGPYLSGEIVTQSHTWSKRGAYSIQAKAKDIYGNESDWATLDVTMPFSYNIPFPSFWQRFFERFPHAFPILRYLMRY